MSQNRVTGQTPPVSVVADQTIRIKLRGNRIPSEQGFLFSKRPPARPAFGKQGDFGRLGTPPTACWITTPKNYQGRKKMSLINQGSRTFGNQAISSPDTILWLGSNRRNP